MHILCGLFSLLGTSLYSCMGQFLDLFPTFINSFFSVGGREIFIPRAVHPAKVCDENIIGSIVIL